MQLKNTLTLNLELYVLKTRIRSVIFLKMRLYAIIDSINVSSSNIAITTSRLYAVIVKLNFQYRPTLD